MSEQTKKQNKSILHFCITISIMIIFRFIPSIGSITPYGMAIIGIFLGLIYGWSVDADNLIWTSMLGLIALGLTDFGNTGKALATAFGNESVMLMLLGMFFIGMLQDSHLTEWFSNRLLSAKFVQGKPWRLTALIILGPGLLTILVNQTLVALIMLAVYSSIFTQAGYKKGDMYPAMVLMGFMVVCNIAFSLFPFRGWCLMTVGMATKAGIQINMGGWIICAAITLLVACIGWILMMRIIPGCMVEPLKEIDITDYAKNPTPLSKRQKAVLIILLINIIGCIFLSFAAGQDGIRLYFSKVGVYGWVVFLIGLAMVWHVDGEPVLNKKTAPSYFYWDLIMVVAAAMVVAGQITSPETGITPMVGKLLAPIFGLSDYLMLLILGVITFLLTNFANNVAVTITMMTIAMTMSAQTDFNLQVALMVITIYGVIGLLTPAGSVNGAMIHSHGFTTAKSAYKAGAIMFVFLTILMAIVLIPLGLKFMN